MNSEDAEEALRRICIQKLAAEMLPRLIVRKFDYGMGLSSEDDFVKMAARLAEKIVRTNSRGQLYDLSSGDGGEWDSLEKSALSCPGEKCPPEEKLRVRKVFREEDSHLSVVQCGACRRRFLRFEDLSSMGKIKEGWYD